MADKELHIIVGKTLEERGGWTVASHEGAGKALAELLALGGIHLTNQDQAQLIVNQAMELGRLRNFIYEIYGYYNGLAVWEPGYDGGKYSDIAADAKAVWDEKMAEPDG